MRPILSLRLVLLSATLLTAAAANLDIYYIDVEGGAATLIVTSAGESLLADTGWRRDDDRDAKRIQEVATRQAGLKKIDYLLITHFHMDHVGGLPALAKRLPIGKFLDHGDRVETRPGADAENWAAYQVLTTANKRMTLKPGDRIPIWQVHLALAADKEHNTDERMIANLEPEADCKSHWLRVSVEPSGKYTITNSRNGFSKSYMAR